MNNDDFKKRLERLTDHQAPSSPMSSDGNNQITIEKLVQVLTETRRDIREGKKKTQQEISDLQSKLETTRKLLRNQEIRTRDMIEEIRSLKEEYQQLLETIIQVTPRKRRFWPFKSSRPC
jgi:DNA anti-recombination protein RmuC